ncbi:MAG: hypothetical protein M2R45_00465 [Verrucomicrobia subdivision 3 bacterium]|nr:hypothetical protein [Limisphaerales bacterium]MCS1413655.1 hypothetical protein [Limisphaerales bacterium]
MIGRLGAGEALSVSRKILIHVSVFHMEQLMGEDGFDSGGLGRMITGEMRTATAGPIFFSAAMILIF